jgi:hypothetical protein
MSSKPFLVLQKGRHKQTFMWCEVDDQDLVGDEIWIPEEGPISHSGILQTHSAAVQTISDALHDGWTCGSPIGDAQRAVIEAAKKWATMHGGDDLLLQAIEALEELEK